MELEGNNNTVCFLNRLHRQQPVTSHTETEEARLCSSLFNSEQASDYCWA